MKVQIVPVPREGVPEVPCVKEKGGHGVGTPRKTRIGVQGVHDVEERAGGRTGCWEGGNGDPGAPRVRENENGDAGKSRTGVPGDPKSRKRGSLGAGIVRKEDRERSHPGKDDRALGNGGDGHLGGVQGSQVVEEGVVCGAGQDRAQVRDICGDSTVTTGTRGHGGGHRASHGQAGDNTPSTEQDSGGGPSPFSGISLEGVSVSPQVSLRALCVHPCPMSPKSL